MDEKYDPLEGGGGEYGAPDQPVYTEEQRAMIMAAMMEELGIARKETLPLEDGERQGRLRDPHPISQAPAPRKARRYSAGTLDKINGWKNFTPGDLTEEDLQLSSIADGQLARLRRGGGSGITSDRERGGTSIRGGHSHNADRGRGQASRDGRGFQSVEQQMGRSSSINMSVPTPQTYFNDERMNTRHMAHMAMKYPSTIDSAIARLRSGPPANPSAPQPSSLAPSRKDSSSIRPNSTVVLPAETQSRWGSNPLDPNVFLNAMGFGNDAFNQTSQVASVASTERTGSGNLSLAIGKTALSVTVAGPSRITSSFEKSLDNQKSPQIIAAVSTGSLGLLPDVTSDPSLDVGSSNQIDSRSSAQGISTQSVASSLRRPVPLENIATVLKKPVGIMASRWAPQTAVPSALSQQNTSTPQTIISQPLERKIASQIYRDHVVKIQRGKSQPKPGQARLLRYTASDAEITLELLQNENLILRETINKEVVVTHMAGAASITFQAAGRRKEDCSIWTITFQVPFQAKKFHDLIEDHKNGQPAFGTSIHQRRPSIIAFTSEEKPGTARSSSNAAERSRGSNTSNTDSQAVLIQLKIEAEVSTSQSAASQSKFANPVFNFGGLLEQEPIDLQQFSFPSVTSLQNNGESDTRIGTQSLNDPTAVTSVAPLISFAGDNNEQPSMDEKTSAAHNLNLLFDNKMSMSTLDYLDKSPYGSLLVQLSRVVVRKGGIAASGLTGKEILSCPLYMDAAINLVGNFLSGSETFSRLPDHESIKLMKQQTTKVLELAVAARGESIMTPNTSHIEVTPTLQLAIMPATNVPKSSVTDEPREIKLAGPSAWSSLLGRIKPGNLVDAQSTLSTQGSKQVSKIKHLAHDVIAVSPTSSDTMHFQQSSIDELTKTFSGFSFTDVVQRPAPLAARSVPIQELPETTAKRSPLTQDLSRVHRPRTYANLFDATHGDLKGLPGLNQSIWCPILQADPLASSFPTRNDTHHQNNAHALEAPVLQPKPNIEIPSSSIQGLREPYPRSGRTALSPVRRENVQTEVQKQTELQYRD